MAPEGSVSEARIEAPTLSIAALDMATQAPDARVGAAALKLCEVTKRFGAVAALDRLTFDVRRGEIHGLIGPNGAGKTTAVNIATGVYRPSSGSVWLDGADVTRVPSHRRAAKGLARSFQGARLFDQLDVRTNLTIAVEQRRACAAQSASRADIHAEVDELLDEARLTAVAATMAGQLPYGVRKQVEVIRSCAFASTALLLDEPTAGLGPDDIDQVLGLMASHRARLAILIIEHDMEVIMSLCDRVTVIDAGRWLMTGTPAEVQASQDVVAAYLGADE
jgi:ABC-type branched-subunit amino acid transport system ATPase component